MSDQQRIKASHQAIALQSGRDIVVYDGITEDRAREIARQAVEGELERFERTAYLVAESRTSQLRTELIERFRQLPDAQLGAFEDPDVQMLVRDAQKEYMRSGTDEHRSTLIDLIAARTKAAGGGMQAAVIRSAVELVPRMPSRSIPLLTICWLMTVVKVTSGVSNRLWLTSWAEQYLAPFLENFPYKETDFTFMETLGLGTISIGEIDLSTQIADRYPALFQNGFEIDEIDDELKEFDVDALFLPSLDGDGKLQVRALDADVAEEEIRKLGASEGATEKYKNLLAQKRKDSQSVEQLLRDAHPAWGTVLDTWKNTAMKGFRPNLVGFAIAHCHFTSVTGDAVDLELWVPD